MKKLKKISLFIIGFYLLLLLLGNSKIEAATKTVTTVQELQEVMGATSYSTIDGTTLKITKDFTWTIPESDSIEVKIPELIIDFNEKEIRIENNKKTNLGIHLLEGKVIFKDSTGEKGGIYSTGNFIYLENKAELIIENGQYTAGHVQESDKGIITNVDNGLIRNLGGTIIVKNGEFKTMEHSKLFQFVGGKMTINNGNFEGKGTFIHVEGNRSDITRDSELVINGGLFDAELAIPMQIDAYGLPLKVKVNGGSFIATGTSCIGIREFKNRNDWTERNGVDY